MINFSRTKCVILFPKGVTDSMIEIVYEKEKQKPEGNEGFFRIPNNIRQIGEIRGTQKIYIEDYAYTYLCRISSENSHRGIAAILLGQANWKEGISYLFIKSAVALPDMEVTEEHLTFTQEIWNHVYEKNKEYFPEQEVVGWFLSIPAAPWNCMRSFARPISIISAAMTKCSLCRNRWKKKRPSTAMKKAGCPVSPAFTCIMRKNEPMRNFLIAQNERAETENRGSG